jgi:molybdopterin/thiamine biosynthesis adenylyltransferase
MARGLIEMAEPDNEPLDYLRQLGIVDPSRYGDTELTVIGAGGIGSPTIMALTKTGFNNITVWDADKVDGHNIPNQMYRPQDIGKLKVEAISLICREWAKASVVGVPEMYSGQKPLSGIVISGVDSMEARKTIWEKGIRYNPGVGIYIEGRMAGQWGMIHTVRPCDPDMVEWYESTTLYPDKEVEPVACTDRAIAYNVFGLASLIVNQVAKHVKGEETAKEIIYDLVNVSIETS